MRFAAFAVSAALLGGAASPQNLSNEDFQQLMDAAVVAGVSTAQTGTRIICVQRELESPLKHSRDSMDLFHSSAMPGLPVTKATPGTAVEQAAVEKAFAVAISPAAVIASRTVIEKIPLREVAYSSAAPMPARCVINRSWASSGTAGDFVTTLQFSRPVFANGFAFIEQVTDCPGLCGSGWLRVFKKRRGKWKQVQYRNLFVS